MLYGVEQGETEAATSEQPQSTCGVRLRWRRETCGPEHRVPAGRYFQCGTKHPGEFLMKKGYFGDFGGQFVPELLMPPLRELEAAMATIMSSPSFQEELDDLLRNFAGRETPAGCSVFCVVFHSRRGAETNAGRNPALRYTRHTAGHGEQ